MTTTETNDGESAERNASRRRQTEQTSPSAEGTDFQMVTFKENGMISKQISPDAISHANFFFNKTNSHIQHLFSK